MKVFACGAARSALLRALTMAWLMVFAAGLRAEQLQTLPALKARVTDLTATLSVQQAGALEQRMAAFEREHGSQMALLIVQSTQPETIEAFSIRLAETWKIGRKGVDDGVILVVATDDRALRIEVGYGLEGVLNDATARRIIDEIILPRFREGDTYGGIEAGLSQLQRVVAGEPLPAPEPQSDDDSWTMSMDDGGLMMQIVFGIVIASSFLRALIGRLAAGLLAGSVGGGAAWFFSGSWTLGLALALILLVGVAAGGGGGISRGGRGGGMGGSGGGGSFGGGGASGRW